MHPYLPIFLPTFAAAQCRPETVYPKAIEEELGEVERWLEDKEHSKLISDYRAEQFPPVA